MLHTSDWHLGRSFHGAGLQRAHELYFDHLCEVVRAERIDAVLVSGDIYDRALPSPDSIALLDETLNRLLELGTKVVLSSGNHDSAVRLGFGSRAMERSGLFIRTGVGAIGRPIDLHIADNTARITALPYLEPAVTAEQLEATERTHAAVLRAAITRAHESVRAATESTAAPFKVVMAHAFVTGATTCESERDISVGGVGAVPVSVFDDFDYVALGHIHGAQQLTERARYSGSPVAMSFSEAGHVKGSVVIDTVTGVQTFLEAPVEREVAVLRGTLQELLTDARLSGTEGSYCQVTLTDEARPLGAMDRIRSRFPHTLQLLFDQPATTGAPVSYASRLRSRTDLDVCCEFLPHVRGGASADDSERDVIRRALDATAQARRLADDESSDPTTDESPYADQPRVTGRGVA